MTMNSKFYIFLLLIIGWSSLFAQYVRQQPYRTEHQRRMQYALDDWISYMESKQISSMTVGTSYLYFGTLDGGILRYHLYQNFWDYPFTTSNGLPDNRVLDVAYDSENNLLWAKTDVDVAIFKSAEQEWLSKSETDYWPYKYPAKPEPQTDKAVSYDIFYSRKYLSLLPPYFANGNYTITGDWKIMDEHFDEYPVTGFLRDHWERIWFVIEDLGIGIGNTFAQRLDVFPFGLTNIFPRAMAYQYDDIWIGGEPRNDFGRPGIVRWKDSDGGWEYFQARWIADLPSDHVSDIAVTGDSVWFATDYGLSLYDSGKHRWKNFNLKDGLFSQEVNNLLVSGQTLFIGTRGGLNVLDMPSGVLKRVKDKAIRLATVYQLAAQKDTIWAATNRGISRFRTSRTGWLPVPTKAAIQDLPVYAVETFGNEIWFSSPGGIFWLDSKTDKWESFPQIGMELGGPFADLAVNDKSVWVSTPEGLLKYDRVRKYWRLFTVEDGLLDNDCYRLLLDGDYIWVTNRSGITQFYWNNPNRID